MTKSIPVVGSPKPQTDDNRRGPDYENDTPRGWLTGTKPATDKPDFDVNVHGGKGPKRSGPPNAETWGRSEARKRYGG